MKHTKEIVRSLLLFILLCLSLSALIGACGGILVRVYQCCF
jgi:hypothetical protein